MYRTWQTAKRTGVPWMALVAMGIGIWSGIPALAGVADKGSKPWAKLFESESWYKSQPGKEQVFAGRLEAMPRAGGIGILQRTSFYKLGDRTIYTGARKNAALDRLVGKQVEIRGKPVDMELEGRSLREIWPAAVRPAGDK